MKLNIFKRYSKSSTDFDHDLRIIIHHNRLSASNVAELKELYFARVTGQSIAVLSFENLSFIDSSGLGFLVELRQQLQSPKLMILEGIADPTLLELFTLTRMDQVFVISESKAHTKDFLEQFPSSHS